MKHMDFGTQNDTLEMNWGKYLNFDILLPKGEEKYQIYSISSVNLILSSQMCF